uniref:dephospho-CoA kinase n=1 Tax=Dialister sp. TaxID=1955814 RepID=UPI0040295EFD
RAFGEAIFNKDGTLDRLKTAEIVFTKEEKRQQLNAIIHPFIWRRTQEELLKAQEEGHDLVVLDMPLLLEISWQLRVEEVWIVKVPLEMQIERVTLRDGFTREQVLDRIHKQMPTDNKLNYADVIIDNSRSVEDTRRQVREALAKAKERMRNIRD